MNQRLILSDDSMEKELNSLGQAIQPSPDHLQRILRELSVTPETTPRYDFMKGRNVFTNFFALMNVKRTSGIIAVAFIAVVGAYAGYSQLGSKSNTANTSVATDTDTIVEPVREPLVVPTAPTTSNIDDIAAAFTQELEQESTIVSESDSDADLIAYDSSTLTDYSNLYEDSEL